MKSLQKRNSESTKGQILEAAMRLLRARSYQSVTVDDIMKCL